MTLDELYPWADYAVRRISAARQDTIALQRTKKEAQEMTWRLNRRCGTPGKRGVRYETVKIWHPEDEEGVE